MANETAGRPAGKALWIWEGYLLLLAVLPAAGSVVLAKLPIPIWISWAFTGLWAALWLFFAVFFLPVMHRKLSYRLLRDRLEVHTGAVSYTHLSRRLWSSFRRIRRRRPERRAERYRRR